MTTRKMAGFIPIPNTGIASPRRAMLGTACTTLAKARTGLLAGRI